MTVDIPQVPAALTAWNTQIPNNVTGKSPYEILNKLDFQKGMKSPVAISGAGAQSKNLFQFTGTIKASKIAGIFTTVVNSTTLSGCYFDIWDGAVSVPLNDTGTPTDCSGAVSGASVGCYDMASNDMTFLNADQVRMVQSPPQYFILQSKTGATSYLRFNYTGDANTDVTASFYLEMQSISDDGSIVPA